MEPLKSVIPEEKSILTEGKLRSFINYLSSTTARSVNTRTQIRYTQLNAFVCDCETRSKELDFEVNEAMKLCNSRGRLEDSKNLNRLRAESYEISLVLHLFRSILGAIVEDYVVRDRPISDVYITFNTLLSLSRNHEYRFHGGVYRTD